MQIFVPTIWEEATKYSKEAPPGMEQLLIAGAEVYYLKGLWGMAFSQFVARKGYTFWMHYFLIAENPVTLFAAAAKDSLALLMVLHGALGGTTIVNSYQSSLVWTRSQARNSWVLPKGKTLIVDIDFEPSFKKSGPDSPDKTAYLSRDAQLLLQKLPENFSTQSAPDLYLDGIAANLLHEHLVQVQQQADDLLLDNPPFHFLQKDLDNIRKVKARVDASVDKRLSVKQLAVFAGTNRDMINRGFKYVYGQTLHQYWLGISLAYAKELVLGSNESVKNIAAACGFDQYSHFIQQFKKYWGMTPGEMRKTI